MSAWHDTVVNLLKPDVPVFEGDAEVKRQRAQGEHLESVDLGVVQTGDVRPRFVGKGVVVEPLVCTGETQGQNPSRSVLAVEGRSRVGGDVTQASSKHRAIVIAASVNSESLDVPKRQHNGGRRKQSLAQRLVDEVVEGRRDSRRQLVRVVLEGKRILDGGLVAVDTRRHRLPVFVTVDSEVGKVLGVQVVTRRAGRGIPAEAVFPWTDFVSMVRGLARDGN